VPGGGVLGAMDTSRPGANDWIERISTRGWSALHLETARALLDEGQASVNLVAAIPSLHAGLSAAIAAFLWRRVHRRWRPVLVTYVLVMAFTLVYSAEHYVIDILLGWALAAVVLAATATLSPREPSPGTPSAGTPSSRERACLPGDTPRILDKNARS
jgi:membrane-associated phospholipid phosphatase